MIESNNEKIYNFHLRKNPLISMLIIILGAVLCTPYLSSAVSTTYVLMLCLLITVLIVINVTIYRNIEYTRFKSLLALVLFFGQILSYQIFGYSTAAIGNTFNQIAALFWIIVFYFVFDYYSIEEKRKITNVFTIIILINILYNVVINILIPGASSKVLRLDWYPNLANKNIGGTRFSTLCLFFFITCLLIFVNSKDKRQRRKYLIFAIISAFYIVFCGMRMTVIILSILVTVLIYLTKDINRRNIPIVIILILLTITIIVFSEQILSGLVALLPSGRISDRVIDILSSMKVGIDDDSFSGRFGLTKTSISTFTGSIRNFLIGIGDHRVFGEGLSGYYGTGIGGHSEFFDTLARFGILGGLLLYCSLKNYFSILKRTIASKTPNYRKGLNAAILVLVLCMVFKAVFYPEVGFVLFLYLPLSSNTILDNPV